MYNSSYRPHDRRQFLQQSALGAAGVWLANFPTLAAAEGPSAKRLRVVSQTPFNAEPEIGPLTESHITPVEQFFVRCHGTIPQLNSDAFDVSVEGLVRKPQTLNLRDIKTRFPQHTVEATLTCAGNRRTELSAIKKVAGVAWDTGAIGNAQWTGASLGDILKACELTPEAKHVWFEGADPVKEKDGSTAPFGASIPIQKALSIENNSPGALIAYLMNKAALLPEHGFPFRTLVPGFIGARSVKWLKKITVSDRPSPNHYVADAYKLVQADSVEERATKEPIYEYVVNGAIALPTNGVSLKSGDLNIVGYALPSGRPNTTVRQVSISINNGKSWADAKLIGTPNPYCWQLWKATINVASNTESISLRVTDSDGNTQPTVGNWNLKGYLYNGWHKIPVTIKQ